MSEEAIKQTQKDCLECKIIATTGLTLLGLWAFYERNKAPPVNTSLRNTLAVVGVGSIGLGIARFFSNGPLTSFDRKR